MPRPLTATLAARASRCLHSWFLECHGDPAERASPDAGLRRLFEKGLAREREVVATLDGFVEPQWDRKNWNDGHAATVALMQAGAPWIYQGVLVRGDARARPDLLRRVQAPSRLGAHTYEPIDVKNHQAVTGKDRVQLLVCGHLLEPVLGEFPGTGGIWLSTGEIGQVDLAADIGEITALIDEMRGVRDGGRGTEPLRCAECPTCPWRGHCRRQWAETRHVSLVYGVDAELARRLIAAELRTFDALAAQDPPKLARRLEIDEDRAARLCASARARAENRIIRLSEPCWPEGPAVHFYDIETYGDEVYLHGVIRADADGSVHEHQFLALDPSDEVTAWRGLLDYFATAPAGPIYTWTDYERLHVRLLWQRHGGNPAGYKRLEGDMVDLCALVRDHYAPPTSSYGLKDVAPLFGFAWGADDAGGLASEAWYEEWLATAEVVILQRIREYNLDDVRAMLAVYSGLRVEPGA